MAVATDRAVAEVKRRMRPRRFEEAVGYELSLLVQDVAEERLSAHLLWYRLLRDCFNGIDRTRTMSALRNPDERERLKAFMKASAAPKLRELIAGMLDVDPVSPEIAAVDAEELGIDPAAFIETYYYDTKSSRFVTFFDSGKVILRVYYSLDHTLGAGAEGTLHIALMGAVRKTTEDPNVPLQKRYRPVCDSEGCLLVSPRIMVAKKPHISATQRASISLERHELGGINLRDLTLPHFYTPESKKTLPGLWSLPRFSDFGKDKRLYYEYIEGALMQSLMEEEQFDLLARLIAIKHMAQTLHYMHAMGYVHNDIKPQNVLVSKRGAAVIIDFGLAEKYIAAHRNLKSPRYQKIAGTPFYMSPEQITKRSRASRAISDIRYAAPIRSQEELAWLRRQSPEKIVFIDGIEFRETDADCSEEKTPFFHDAYLHANVFSDERGAVVPITGKSDVFSLGINLLVLSTGMSHVHDPHDVKRILRDVSDYRLCITGIRDHLPSPLNIANRQDNRCYRELLEKLILDMLDRYPHRRPAANEVAQRLREIIWLFFGSDRAFFSTFDDECTYVRNRLFRESPAAVHS